MIILRTKQFAKGVRQFKKLRKLQGEFEMNKRIIDECKKKLSDKTITNPEEIEKLKNKLKEAEIGFETAANKTIRENMVLDMRADKKGLSDDIFLDKVKNKYNSRLKDIVSPISSKDKLNNIIDEAKADINDVINTKLSPKSEELLRQKINQSSDISPILRNEIQISNYVKNISDEEINRLITNGDIKSRSDLENVLKRLSKNPRNAQTISNSNLSPQNDAVLIPNGTNIVSEAHEILGHGTRLTNGDEVLNPARNANYLHPNFHIRTEQAANDNVRKISNELKLPQEDLRKLNKALDKQEKATILSEYGNEIYGRWRK